MIASPPHDVTIQPLARIKIFAKTPHAYNGAPITARGIKQPASIPMASIGRKLNNMMMMMIRWHGPQTASVPVARRAINFAYRTFLSPLLVPNTDAGWLSLEV